ncbi:MAG: heme NO-binding domain-containing protein [Planctomycetes bacterium]|nr:heme NO-binding domain-containing protein [Planctomycetota bacterium]
MKGVVFSELLDWIERSQGLEVLDEVLLDAGLAHGGAYTSAGTYDWRELVAIVDSLSRRTGATGPELLRRYGQSLFPAFAERFAELVGAAAGPFELLAGIGAHIEREVSKLYADPEVPTFRVEPVPGGVVVDYESARPLADLALGMIEGCCAHYGMPVDIVASGSARRRRFEVLAQPEAT